MEATLNLMGYELDFPLFGQIRTDIVRRVESGFARQCRWTRISAAYAGNDMGACCRQGSV